MGTEFGTEFDKNAPDNTFIVPPSEAMCDFASLPTQPDTFRIEPEGNTFYVTQRSRKH